MCLLGDGFILADNRHNGSIACPSMQVIHHPAPPAICVRSAYALEAGTEARRGALGRTACVSAWRCNFVWWRRRCTTRLALFRTLRSIPCDLLLFSITHHAGCNAEHCTPPHSGRGSGPAQAPAQSSTPLPDRQVSQRRALVLLPNQSMVTLPGRPQGSSPTPKARLSGELECFRSENVSMRAAVLGVTSLAKEAEHGSIRFRMRRYSTTFGS